MSGSPSPRVRAARLVDTVMAGRGSLAEHMVQAREGLEPRDAGFMQALVYGCLRHGPRLQFWLSRLLDKPLRPRDRIVGSVVMLGLYQLAFSRVPTHAAVSESVEAVRELDRPRATGLVNALLRRFQREQAALEEAMQISETACWMHPNWLIQAFRADWPADWQAILASGNEEPPMSLRVNRQRASREAVLAGLAETDIEAAPVAGLDDAIRLARPRPVDQLPGFAEGQFSVQDESAQLVADLLDPPAGARVLDVCAAPGGKTAHLLERAPTLDVTALDRDAARLKRVNENLERLGLQADCVAADARETARWWDGRPFDCILVDAPCSGTGVIRRHPDIKYLRRKSDIAGLATLQEAILAAAFSTLVPGGRLLYTTCSVLAAENAEVIERFLAREPAAEVVAIQVPGGQRSGPGWQRLPSAAGGDGFFYAGVRRVPGK
ncbi:16S rRNA (cytosine(967)-C(5))-methyltransferase RsmB [Gammaproteobacteria bacterium AB-CW1]|uniref:16S rRNA (cytosine(967)-C(5))-methyltransferase n=1 Tax=Natronospira elongata TaxID=3110268 RepID=A0AAP6JG39_9GAMM|nr:16S rRNA (cytosine(967)-C(5))-methyltransferase RsmB [Gammaproteobacteria bacterium AB-CW1]